MAFFIMINLGLAGSRKDPPWPPAENLFQSRLRQQKQVNPRRHVNPIVIIEKTVGNLISPKASGTICEGLDEISIYFKTTFEE
jgi:hypothetical protein